MSPRRYVHAGLPPQACKAFRVLRSPMVIHLSQVGSGGSEDQRCITTKEQSLLVCETIRKDSLSLNYAVSTPHNGVLLVTSAKRKNLGLEKFSIVILLTFKRNLSPLVLPWSYVEARSVSELGRMKWKWLLAFYTS